MSALIFSSLENENVPPISLANRGLAYGDGIFETLRVVDGKIPLIDYHRARFVRGVEVLGLGNVSEMLSIFDCELEQTVNRLIALGRDTALIKVFAVRKEGGRGYAPVDNPVSDVFVQAFELPHYPSDYYQLGISLKLCEFRLGQQPALAGIKHLNRLEQVMASRELGESPEGIVLDQNGCVVEGTKSNLLVFKGDQILTPEITSCGVRGTLVSALLAGEVPDFKLVTSTITVDELRHADSLAMVNSVFGLWPVASFDGSQYTVSNVCRALQSGIAQRFGFVYESH